MKSWLAHHLHSLRIAADRLRDTPLASLFTMLVIGVALSLPTGLYLVMHNLDSVAGGIKTQAEITVFLKTDATDEVAKDLAARIGKRADVQSVRFVSRAEGLAQLQKAGLADIMAGLPDNPLPDALVLVPKDSSPDALNRMAENLGHDPNVDKVSLDAEWVRRLSAFIQLGHELVVMLAVLLGFALATITGNTIRLQIYAQRDEIEVARLIGATDRFIRRPFLYFGGLQGLTGGLVAWLIVTLAASMIRSGVAQVAASYGTSYQILGLNYAEVGSLLLGAALLGFLGAYFAVSQTLSSLNTR